MKYTKHSNGVEESTPIFALKILFLALCGFNTSIHAAPTGGVVSTGSATIQSSGATTVVTQGSQKAIVNWQGFNVGTNEAVNFVQPNSSAVILNRVQSPNGSVIQGQITANGKVFLINPNGILFSQGSSVNVGGFVASSLGLSDTNFINGSYKFSGDGQGAVTNQGTITTNGQGGYVAMIGSKVVNEGVITARMGTVALAAGSAVTLDMAGDQLLNVTVDQGAVDALVRNGHLIQADGGLVILTTQGAGSLLATAVNNTGVIQAQSIDTKNGVIRLSADGTTGVVNLSGTLDVSGATSGQKGGEVQVTAHTVNLTQAKIKASGDAGGGVVLIGGNFHGAGPLANAQTTTMDRGSQIEANATRTGDGGKIAVWSNGTTAIDGTFNARGGLIAGNGGFVETSGQVLSMGPNATVNTLAPKGLTGTWLVDPFNYEICALCTGLTGESAASVIAKLVTSNYTIQADNNITVSEAISFTTAARTLTLNAGNSILINATMDTSGIGSGFKLIAGSNITTNSTITTSGSDSLITLSAGNDALINAAMTASNLNSIISITATRDITATGTLTASQSGTEINLTAHRDLTAGTVTAAGGGLLNLIADRNVSVNTATATGTATLKADAKGAGPGVAAGTVTIVTAVTAATTVLRFNPVSYAATATEIAAYTAKITGAKDVKAWVFASGVNKEYDTSASATLAFIGTPTDAGAITLNPGTATFSSPNAGTSVPVSYSSYSISGAASPSLALFSASGSTTANITPKAITATATGVNKVYDGTTSDSVTVAVTALPGDTLTASSSTAYFTDKNVGTAKPVSVSGITLSGSSAANYTVNSTAATTANITPATLVISATGNNKAYDGTTTATVGLTDNRVAGDVLTTSYTSANFTSASVGDNKLINVAGLGFAGTDSGNYSLLNTTATSTANITAFSSGGSTTVTPADVVIVSTASGALAIAPIGPIDLANSNYMFSAQSGGWGASGLVSPEVAGVANQLSGAEAGESSALSNDSSGTVRVIGVTGGTAAILTVMNGALPQQMTSFYPAPASSVVPVGPQRVRRQNRN